MKKLDTSFITSTAFQPVKQGTLDHIQQAYIETVDALAKAGIGSSYDATKVYVLYGCAKTGTDPGVRTVDAGAVFFNGEVYLVDAFSGTTTGSNVLIGTINVSFAAAANADPVLFTDGSSHNVHQIRKIVISIGASGSGVANFIDWLKFLPKWVSDNSISGYSFSPGAGAGTVTLARRKSIKVGEVVTMSFYVKVNISSAVSSGGSLYIPLDYLTAPLEEFSRSPTAIADLVANTIVVGIAQISTSVFPGFMVVYFVGNLTTGDKFFEGQIIYEGVN